jgi:hypothetical protein
MTEAVEISITVPIDCGTDAAEMITLLNDGLINPLTAATDSQYAVAQVEKECATSSGTIFKALIAVPQDEVAAFQAEWVDSPKSDDLGTAFRKCVNAGLVSNSHDTTSASFTVAVASSRCEPDPCANGGACSQGSSNGVVANTVVCSCGDKYEGPTCGSCKDHEFIKAAAGESDVDTVLSNTFVNFIASCGEVHEVQWAAVELIMSELRRACDIVAVEQNQRQEDLEGIRNSLIREGGCVKYRVEFATFNTTWTDKLNKHSAKMTSWQNTLTAVLAAIESGPFSEADKAKAASFDTVGILDLDAASCLAQYSQSDSHNYLDTLRYAERAEITRTGNLLTAVDMQWNTVRTIYLDCNYIQSSNREDIVAAWMAFAADFSLTTSRRLDGPKEVRRLEGKAAVGQDGASSVWKAVSNVFE